MTCKLFLVCPKTFKCSYPEASELGETCFSVASLGQHVFMSECYDSWHDQNAAVGEKQMAPEPCVLYRVKLILWVCLLVGVSLHVKIVCNIALGDASV